MARCGAARAHHAQMRAAAGTGSWLDAAAADPLLMPEFQQLCAFGGRMAGSGGDEAALDWAVARLRALGGATCRVAVPYDGWVCEHAELHLSRGSDAVACRPLLRSASTPPDGLEAQVLDLGAGRPADFDAAGDRLRGRIALVRHEYPFSPTHLHRRRKYDLAVARGAVGFLIANHLPDHGLLSGSSGRLRGAAGIPAAYITHEGALLLAAHPDARVHLVITGRERDNATAGVVVWDLPGERAERVVLSAHIDGHDLGCSALDNATGVAVALAAARSVAARVGDGSNSLRVCLFSAEEWALAGSAGYLKSLAPAELDTLKLNINLDTVAGDDSLTALTSGFPGLAPLVRDAGTLAGVPVGIHQALMPNSDHANFAAAGVPALRLLAGFDRPLSRVRHILSAQDRVDVVEESELRTALRVTCALAAQGLSASPTALERLAAGSEALG